MFMLAYICPWHGPLTRSRIAPAANGQFRWENVFWRLVHENKLGFAAAFINVYLAKLGRAGVA